MSQISFQGPGGRQELMNANGERSIEDKASTIVQKIHWTGAFLAFVGGLVWMTIQVERESKGIMPHKICKRYASAHKGSLGCILNKILVSLSLPPSTKTTGNN